ncbi:MAG TPA: molybdenum cofactor guanylyltransferase [Gemmatimonadaceae bacterium]
MSDAPGDAPVNAPGDAPGSAPASRAPRWPSPHTLGAILAGGESSRFGGKPKGLELVEGARMIDRVAAALREVTGELLLVANDPGAGEWLPGARVVPDRVPKAGPLAGIQAALHAANDRGVLVVAWDMPFVSAALLRAIAERGEAAHAIVVPEARTGRAEPACAYYPGDCLHALDRFLAEGRRRPAHFIEEYGCVARLGPPDLVAFGDPARLLSSVNTPDEHARLTRGGE